MKLSLCSGRKWMLRSLLMLLFITTQAQRNPWEKLMTLTQSSVSSGSHQLPVVNTSGSGIIIDHPPLYGTSGAPSMVNILGDGRSIYSADYFELGSDVDPLSITIYGAAGVPYNLAEFNVFIYADSNGKPAGIPGVSGTPLFAFSSLAPEDVTYDENSGAITIDVVAANGGVPVTIPAGNYWLVPFGLGEEPGVTQWAWAISSSSEFNQGAMIADPGMIMFPSDWTSLESLGAPFRHLAWTLTGNLEACSGAPTAGSSRLSNPNGNPGSSYTVYNSGQSLNSGLNFQWESDRGDGWESRGAVSNLYVPAQATALPDLWATETWRLKVTCLDSGQISYSSPVTFTTQFIYCEINFSGVEPITKVSFSNVEHNSFPTSNYYEDFSYIKAYVSPGESYPMTVEGITGPYVPEQSTIVVWIDWNQNGDFDTDERTEIGILDNNQGLPGISVTGNIVVPTDALPGRTRMRVIMTDDPYSNSCGYVGDFGQVEDYSIVVGPPLNCPTPSTITASDITTDAATISWTAGGTENEWILMYGLRGFDPDREGEMEIVENIPTFSLENLDSSTYYDVYIQAACAGNDYSLWLGPVNFWTDCEVSGLPYVLDFESEGKNRCLTFESNDPSTNWNLFEGNVPGLAEQGFPDAFIFCQHSSPTSEAWFFTGGIALSANTNYEISYKYGSFKASSEVVSNSMKVGFGSSPVASDMAILQDYASIQSSPLEDYITFTVPSDGVYYFGFSLYDSSDFTVLLVDDVKIHLLPDCPQPTNLSASNITMDSATISWTSRASGTDWVAVYGPYGFNPDTAGTTAITEGLPEIMLGELDASTTYQVYVRSDCSGTTYSHWSAPIAFTTLCEIGTVPYLLDFENGSECIEIVTNSPEGWQLITDNYDSYGFVGTYAQYEYDYSEPADSWLFSGGVALHTGITYQISYKYGSAGYDEKMRVAFGMDPTASAMTETIVDYGPITTSPLTDSHSFTVSQDGIYYFGFYVYSDADQYLLFLDDIHIVIDAAEGFVYADNVWSPEDPSGVATSTDNITVINGNPTLSGITTANDITIRSGATLNVESVLNLYGNLTIDGNLIFKSNANGNGELGHVEATSTITGEATVERYMQDVRSYRMVSSAVTTTTSIHDNWQEGATLENPNPNAGFGTHITGSTSGSNGFDATQTGNPSMFTLDNGAWQAVTNTDVNTLVAGTPYLLLVRGDRSVDLTNNTDHSSTTLRATGSLKTGSQTQNFPSASAAGAFRMFGNPYQSAVDMNMVIAGSDNVNPHYYVVYSPEPGDNGGYVVVSLPAGTNNGGYSANQYLQPGQAGQFLTDGAGSSALYFTENTKAPGNMTGSNALSENNAINVRLYTTSNFNSGRYPHDAVSILFDETFSNIVNGSDAKKPMNFAENLGIDRDGSLLSIEQRELPQNGEVYQLHTSGYDHENYVLKIAITGLDGVSFYLDDRFNGDSIRLEVGDNMYGFDVTSNSESRDANRFSIRVESNLGIESADLSGIRLYPNPLHADVFYIYAPKLEGEHVAINISDMAGRQVYAKTVAAAPGKMTVAMENELSAGVYLITVKSGSEVQTLRLMKE